MSRIVLCFLTNLDDPPPPAPPLRSANSSCDFSLLRRSETDSFLHFLQTALFGFQEKKKKEVNGRVLEQFVRRAPVTAHSIFNATLQPRPPPPTSFLREQQTSGEFLLPLTDAAIQRLHVAHSRMYNSCSFSVYTYDIDRSMHFGPGVLRVQGHRGFQLTFQRGRREPQTASQVHLHFHFE